MVLDVERTLPNFLLRRATKQIEQIERKKRYWWSVFTDVVSSRSIVRDVQNNRHTVSQQAVSATKRDICRRIDD